MAGWKKLHERCNGVFGEKSNDESLTVPCSFHVVFLSVFLLMTMLLLHFIFSFAAQSPSYFLPDTHHLGVCKEPVPKYHTDQRRLAQLRELRAKFFLS